MTKESKYYNAEVLSVRRLENGVYEYYVHWVDFNRRLDQWVNVERLDLSDVRYNNDPRREAKLQLAGQISGSRASSPESDSGGLGKDKKKKGSSLKPRKSSSQLSYPSRYSLLPTPSTPGTPKTDVMDEIPNNIPLGHGKGNALFFRILFRV